MDDARWLGSRFWRFWHRDGSRDKGDSSESESEADAAAVAPADAAVLLERSLKALAQLKTLAKANARFIP